ncbi:hypothetical protein EVAR_14845_1 [Eumeta japonica]|uniref:Uncharacterized protein n=1 Tax=Eumeta variegata TaxID=151549 RepID=A0A4C1V576_EUMVA|nr:hypothetical protein EVAR_14845_1 [Eumeta japonica]
MRNILQGVCGAGRRTTNAAVRGAQARSARCVPLIPFLCGPRHATDHDKIKNNQYFRAICWHHRRRSRPAGTKAVLRGKRTCEPSESRWLPSPMDTHQPRRVISALPTPWIRTGYSMEKVGGRKSR